MGGSISDAPTCSCCGRELTWNLDEIPPGQDFETGNVLPGAKFDYIEAEFTAVAECPGCTCEIFMDSGREPRHFQNPLRYLIED